MKKYAYLAIGDSYGRYIIGVYATKKAAKKAADDAATELLVYTWVERHKIQRGSEEPQVKSYHE